MRFVQRPPRRAVAALLAVAIAATAAVAASSAGALAATARGPAAGSTGLAHTNAVLASIGGHCPWTTAAAHRALTDVELAQAVAQRLSLTELAHFVVLEPGEGFENHNVAVPSLCVPMFTLQDGPDGISTGDTGVTALPASIGIAASFDPTLAYDYGKVLGEEARGKGIDVLQGPNLNLARVPESGRIFEGYGEDPDLVAAMGVADVKGIQSEGVLADAKHLTAYNQETARVSIDEEVSMRALEELYLAPFRAVVEKGNVASIMCAYGELNGVNDCSDPWLYDTVFDDWGFTGFVRSDLKAVANDRAAFKAGLDLVKPGDADGLIAAVRTHHLSLATLRGAATRVLTEMFRFHLLGDTRRGNPYASVTTPAHVAFARRAAEDSMVLLQDDGLLPLRKGGSVAVIGADAATSVKTTGRGSAQVIDPFVSTPLAALRHALGPSTKVTYASGGPGSLELPGIPRADLIGSLPPGEEEPSGTIVHELHAPPGPGPKVSRAALTADAPGSGPNWKHWEATLVVPKSGVYDLSIQDSGDTWAYLGDKTLFASPGVHLRGQWAVTEPLVAGHRYKLSLIWYRGGHAAPPRLGLLDVSPEIAHAAAVARHAQVAVVFVADTSSEGYDRPDLDLPGVDDALVQAVARANPNTVVVLNTGGAVLMPWRNEVGAILEAWYPGEEDGAATAAVLTGRVDPSGRLPLTFPASDAETDASTPAAWPGIDGTVHYLEGLDIGYRYDEVHDLTPAFGFGFGLDYTTFSLGGATVRADGSSDLVTVPVTNTGTDVGTEVVECYLSDPSDSGEPPAQLRAFARIRLKPGATGTVEMRLDRADFEIYGGDGFVVPPGAFEVEVGTSVTALGPPLAAPVPSAT